MLDFLNQKADCTGCAACASACPKHCIMMVRDTEGFLYPEVSGTCVHCGKCERVCPAAHRPAVADRIETVAFAALSNDYEIWKRSSSGGAFSELCYAWGGQSLESVFGGAAWNGLSVEERVVQGYPNIGPLCKSKYVQSSTGNVYDRLKKAVLDGKRAVFCGTPCQIAGFRNYLGRDYDNLLLIDLICHGVGSPTVFGTCMEMIGRQFGDTVVRYEFRAKRRTYEQDYITRIGLASGKQVDLITDPYMQLFLNLDALRPSCVHVCPYRSPSRMGDITIADFKRLLTLFPKLIGEEMNYSSIIINTAKGAEVSRCLNGRMKLLDVPVADIAKYNPLYDHDTNLKTDREAFFSAYIRNPVEAVMEYTHDAMVMKRSIKRRIYDRLPIAMRKRIRKL